jgi:hypothetical protein
MTRGSGGAGCGFALGAVFGFQVGGGDLAGVEEMAGSFAVQLVVGDAAGDLAEGLLNGVEVVQAGQEEAVRGVTEDGRGTDAVLMAVVLAAHGVGWAAGFVVDVLEARVRAVGILDVFCDFGHGYPPGGVWKTWVKCGRPGGFAEPCLDYYLNYSWWRVTKRHISAWVEVVYLVVVRRKIGVAWGLTRFVWGWRLKARG